MKPLVLIILVMACVSVSGQINLSLGLKAHYTFSGNANDVSGNGLNGNIQGGVQLTTDRFGNSNSAYLFDGNTGVIIVNDNGALSTPAFTLCYYFMTQSSSYQNCIGKINYSDGNAATYNSGIRNDQTAYFGTIGTAGNCFTIVPGTLSYTTFSPPNIQMNRWYCVVNTFENGVEKLYIDGTLVSQRSLPISNATVCNNTTFQIGSWWQNDVYRFNGKMDDIRYYDRAINPEEITSLCNVAPPGDTIINKYTAVRELDLCKNSIDVGNAADFKNGDTVLLIQMKGATIDSANSSTFGTVTNYNGAGNYEYNYVKSITGSSIELRNQITRTYNAPEGRVQLVRVPYYKSVTTTKILTCLPWDGEKGGVLAVNAKDTIVLNQDINVSGRGFRGGKAINSQTVLSGANCGTTTYFSPGTPVSQQSKGEGIAEISMAKSSGRGPLANGGGGGNQSNSGGGGGSNSSAGGNGGDQSQECATGPANNGGLPGKEIVYSSTINRMFMGGGGGAGDANDGNGANTFNADGGNGGGIVLINADYLDTKGHAIISNGTEGKICGSNCFEGMGGGGAGGTVVAYINHAINSATRIVASGGRGADNTLRAGSYIQGPGGGGAGGVLYTKAPALLGNIITDLQGGSAGFVNVSPPVSFGATAGTAGAVIQNINLTITQVAFKKNIDSVRFVSVRTGCYNFNFNGTAYTNTASINNWQWYFGDGGTGSGATPSHTYTSVNTFPVKVIVTDINGCKDSITASVKTGTLDIDAGPDTAYCSNIAVKRKLHATGTGPWQWTPAMFLDNPAAQNPVATISNTTKFYVTVTDALGCQGIDSITITVKPAPVVKSIEDAAICKGDQLLMPTSGAATYTWAPAAYVSNPVGSNPSFIGNTTQSIYVTGTAPNGCTGKDTVNVTVKPLPQVVSIPDSAICESQTIALTTTGAISYNWSPVAGLSNAGSSAPSFSASHGNEVYYVTGTGANGCIGKDTVRITIRNRSALLSPPAKEMCFKTSVQLDGNNGNNVEYLWAPASSLNNATVINPMATPSATQVYTLKVTDRICSYETSFSMTVTVNPLPVVKAAKTNDISCSLKISRLSATGGTSYTWSPAASLSGAGTPNPVASPSVSTLYSVTGKDNKGCLNSDTVRVVVKNGLGGYGVPNTFTPNNDARNECFGVQHWGDVQAFYFIIYNRYGEKVFETNNPTICWNGKYRGQPAEPGAYAYYIKGIIGCGPIERKGNVLLVR